MRPDRTERTADRSADHPIDRATDGATDPTDRTTDRFTAAAPAAPRPERRMSEGLEPGRAEAHDASDPDRDDADAWQRIKGRFVDDPDGAIAAAEALVHRTVEHKVRALEEEAAALCGNDGDGNGDGSSTEARRTRLLRYQAYYERLTGLAIR
jgi:hypothetical protein